MVIAGRRAPDLRRWRAVLDSPGVQHEDAWAALDLLDALWAPASAASLLTPSGAPLEFTFRSGSGTLVYTVEPGPPDAPPHAKWRVIQTITSARMKSPSHSSVGAAPRGRPDSLRTNVVVHDQGGHGGPPLPALFDALRQQTGQRFGCWLGVRQGSGAVSYKVYQEVTAAAREQVRCALSAALPTLDPTITLIPQIVGQALPDGPIEFYLRVPEPRPSTLHALLKAAEASEQLRLCFQSLAWLAGMAVKNVPKQLRLGISYRLAPNQPPIASLFIHAVQISERNTIIRERLLDLASQLGLDLARYERATEFLHESDPPLPIHGLVGLTIEPTGTLSLSVGVAPLSLAHSCDNQAYVSLSEE